MSDANAWPPPDGLMTKVVPREHAVIRVSQSIKIKAPAPLVFDTLLDVAAYPSWNSWITSVIVHSQPSNVDGGQGDGSRLRIGTKMTFNAVMNGRKPDKVWGSYLRVTDISIPSMPSAYISTELLEDPTFTSDLSRVYRVSWEGQGVINTRGMQLERFHEVIVTGDSECDVRTWENMSGPLAWAVKWTQEKTLIERMGVMCSDLKGVCEAKHLQDIGT